MEIIAYLVGIGSHVQGFDSLMAQEFVGRTAALLVNRPVPPLSTTSLRLQDFYALGRLVIANLPEQHLNSAGLSFLLSKLKVQAELGRWTFSNRSLDQQNAFQRARTLELTRGFRQVVTKETQLTTSLGHIAQNLFTPEEFGREELSQLLSTSIPRNLNVHDRFAMVKTTIANLIKTSHLDEIFEELKQSLETVEYSDGNKVLIASLSTGHPPSLTHLALQSVDNMDSLWREMPVDLCDSIREKLCSTHQSLEALRQLEEELIPADAADQSELEYVLSRLPINLSEAQPKIFERVAFLARSIDCVNVIPSPRGLTLQPEEIPSHVSGCFDVLTFLHQVHNQEVYQGIYNPRDMVLTDMVSAVTSLEAFLEGQAQPQAQAQEQQPQPVGPGIDSETLRNALREVVGPPLEHLVNFVTNQISQAEIFGVIDTRDQTLNELRHIILTVLRSANTRLNPSEQAAVNSAGIRLQAIRHTMTPILVHVGEGTAMTLLATRIQQSNQLTGSLVDEVTSPLPWAPVQAPIVTESPGPGLSASVGLHHTHKDYTVSVDLCGSVENSPNSNLDYKVGVILRLGTAFLKNYQGSGVHGGFRTLNLPLNLRYEGGCTDGHNFLRQSFLIPFKTDFGTDLTMECEFTFGFTNLNPNNARDFLPLAKISDSQCYGGVVLHPLKEAHAPITPEASFLLPIREKASSKQPMKTSGTSGTTDTPRASSGSTQKSRFASLTRSLTELTAPDHQRTTPWDGAKASEKEASPPTPAMPFQLERRGPSVHRERDLSIGVLPMGSASHMPPPQPIRPFSIEKVILAGFIVGVLGLVKKVFSPDITNEEILRRMKKEMDRRRKDLNQHQLPPKTDNTDEEVS